MQKLHSSHMAEKATIQPREERVGSRPTFGGSRDLGPDSFLPRLSALLSDMGERGPMRSAAFRDMKKLAPRLGKEELWDTANVLLKIIQSKKEDAFERMEAVDALVSVLNAIRRKMEKGEREGIAWSAESQAPVQGALPKVHPAALLHAGDEEVEAEKKRFGRMEGIREQALIGALNSVALAETFDNREIAESIREGISRLDSPYAKKLVNRMALGGVVDPLGKKPGVRTEEPSGPPEKKISIEEMFNLPQEEDFSDVG